MVALGREQRFSGSGVASATESELEPGSGGFASVVNYAVGDDPRLVEMADVRLILTFNKVNFTTIDFQKNFNLDNLLYLELPTHD